MIELILQQRSDRFYSQTSHRRTSPNTDDNPSNIDIITPATAVIDDTANYKATTINIQHKYSDDLILQRSGHDKEKKEWEEQYVHDNTSTIVIKHKYSNDTQRIIAKPDVAMALRSSSSNEEDSNIIINSPPSRQEQEQNYTPIISYLPHSFQPYARLSRMDKPIGTLLLLYPCLWSTILATSSSSSTATTNISAPLINDYSTTAIITDVITCSSSSSSSLTLSTLSLCSLFTIGSFIMRSAGCTINDMWDSNIDKSVSRTKLRPLACGELTHTQALIYLSIQLCLGAGVLVSLPNVEICFLWGVASLPLVALYPIMKRYTNYPQLMLGATFNWGAIMGWVAVHGSVDWNVIAPLYTSCVAWTMVYDTLYAHQDKVDDAKLGLKSTALTFGDNSTKPILTACAVVAWSGWTLAGYNAGLGNVLDMPYYYMGISAAGTHLLWQIYTANLNDVDNLSYRFRSNNIVGGIVLASCIAGNVMSSGCGSTAQVVTLI